MPHWCIRMDSAEGQYWLTHRHRMWSDDPREAKEFGEAEAEEEAKAIRARLSSEPPVPRIRVIAFK